MPHKHMLLNQQKLGRLVPVHVTHIRKRLDEEYQSLSYLKQHKQDYLNQYDQLFRFITIWLLGKGYDLTNHQPHQVLKAVCLYNCPDWDIDLIVQQRHLLKKRFAENANLTSVIELQHCLHFFDCSLQAYDSVSNENI